MKQKLVIFGLILVLVVALAVACAPTPTPTLTPTPTPTPEEYPTQDIRFVSPWGGGGVEVITRQMAHLVEEYLPVSTYVEIIEGGVGGMGALEVMNAAPDGYSILSMAYPLIMQHPRKQIVPGYDLNKLKMLCLVTLEPNVLLVRSDAPWKSLEDFVKDAKSRPGQLTINNCGIGHGTHISTLVMADRLGIEVHPIPGVSVSIMATQLLSGEVDATMTSIGDFSTLLESGAVRGILLMAGERHPLYPDIPTFSELGHEYVSGSFLIMATTAGTPDERVEILENVLYKAHHDPEFQDWAVSIGAQAVWLGSEEVNEWILEAQRETWEVLDRLVAEGVLEE